MQAGVHNVSNVSFPRCLHLVNVTFTGSLQFLKSGLSLSSSKNFLLLMKRVMLFTDLTTNEAHLVQTVTPYFPQKNTNITFPYKPIFHVVSFHPLRKILKQLIFHVNKNCPLGYLNIYHRHYKTHPLDCIFNYFNTSHSDQF